MIKKISFIVLFITSLAFSQQEASVWYFGQNAGLKFQPDGSVTTLSDGQLFTFEGCATIADSNGNLLFYTDGTSVWDKNHIKMPGGDYALGTGLFGDSSSTQSAIIVPKPNDANVYYIFTVDEPHHGNAQVYPNVYSGTYNDGTSTPLYDDGVNNGLNYSIVDLSVTGSNGSVGNVISRNNHLVTYNPDPTGEEIKYKCSEKVTAVMDTATNSYWVITQFVDKFYAFKVTGTGVNVTPVISTQIPVISTSGYRRNAQGYLKASPSGTKLAIAHKQNDFVTGVGDDGSVTGSVYVYDFNLTTGVVTNPQLVLPSVGAYGVEFSKESDLLYVSYVTLFQFPDTKIAQFNLLSSDIPNSKVVLYQGNDVYGALQMAINNKIYYSADASNSLGVINNPDVIGTGCNLVLKQQPLASGTSRKYGLPPFISSFFNASFTTQDVCFGSTTQFVLTTTQSVTSVLWDFGDGSTSNNLSPNHYYALPGNYTVSVTATTATGTSTKSRTVTISTLPIANTIANQSICEGNTTLYDLTQNNSTLLGSQSTGVYGVAYFTSLTNLMAHNYLLPSQYNLPSGTTTLYAKVYNLANANCYAYQSFTITKYLKPISNAVANKFVCDDASNDGLAFFDLDANTTTILGTQSATDFKVTYHATQNDATTGANPLPTNYQNTSNPQIVYVRVENKLSTSCYDASQSFQIGLYTLPKANQPSNLYLCDAGNDGIETFDLTPQNSVILGSQLASDYTITYHNSQNDANLGVNAIGVIQTIQNTKTIYVRIENKLSLNCFDTAYFELTVKPKPVITMDDSYTICQGKSIVVTAPTGFSSYLWSNGSTTNAITITQAGNYSLTVTKDYGTIICDETKNFIVYNSNLATIASIETHDWTDNENDIAVFVTDTSVGDYEYSLDNIHFQDTNQFYGLMNGDYVVYVRDKKGCGTAYKEVFLLMYPKFFTPNGDGFNDVWKIKFSNNEPNLLIYIYDRYGKFVKMLNGLSSGWNGTLTGENLPSDDYWFVVKRENGKEYKGHFTLKR